MAIHPRVQTIATPSAIRIRFSVSVPKSPRRTQTTISRYAANILGFSRVEKTRLLSSGKASPSTHFISEVSIPKINWKKPYATIMAADAPKE